MTGGVVALLAMLTSGGQAAEPRGIHQVAWLEGCWEAVTGARTIEERWMAPRGDNMVGVSRTVRDGRLVEYELIVLREQGGRLAYHAHPSGQPSAVFLSRTVTASSVEFENPAHDFPQRAGYARTGDSLLAWIEGTRDGKARRVEFPYRRVSCS